MFCIKKPSLVVNKLHFILENGLKIMPPRKILRTMEDTRKHSDVSNPRVIIRPLGADVSGNSQYRFSSLPAAAALFNKPDYSDITLHVGDTVFCAHKLILCCASDVFANMLGPNWMERDMHKLTLEEDEDCAKVFHNFLSYLYTGRIVIQDSHVLPLFLLADKYNVKSLYTECVKIVEKELKVFLVRNAPNACDSPSKQRADASASSSVVNNVSQEASPQFLFGHESTDTDSDDSDFYVRSRNAAARKMLPVRLVASETFPISLVMKMLQYSTNERITSAALYNLEARLSNQIVIGNYSMWNDLDQGFIVNMLSDQYFYCGEYDLFKASVSWLSYRHDRQESHTVEKVLGTIRYGTLTTDELYEVERNEYVMQCQKTQKLVQGAVRYKLFQNCLKASAQEDWSGVQFQYRKYKET